MKKIKKLPNGIEIRKNFTSSLKSTLQQVIIFFCILLIIMFTPIVRILFNQFSSTPNFSTLVDLWKNYFELIMGIVIVYIIIVLLIDKKIIIDNENQVVNIFYNFAFLAINKQLISFNSLTSINFQDSRFGTKKLVLNSYSTIRKSLSLCRFSKTDLNDKNQMELLLNTLDTILVFIPKTPSLNEDINKTNTSTLENWNADKTKFVRFLNILRIFGIVFLIILLAKFAFDWIANKGLKFEYFFFSIFLLLYAVLVIFFYQF